MKKIIIILIALANMSMVNDQIKLWQGITIYYKQVRLKDGVLMDYRTVIVEVIEAESLIKAKRLFNIYVMSKKKLKGLECTLYNVYEIKNEDVIRK